MGVFEHVASHVLYLNCLYFVKRMLIVARRMSGRQDRTWRERRPTADTSRQKHSHVTTFN